MPGSSISSPTASRIRSEEVASARIVENGVGARSPGSRAINAATEAKQTTAVAGTANMRQASTSRAVPTRLTVRISRQSAMVGDTPAAWATARNGPRSATLAREAGDPACILHVEDEGLQLGSTSGSSQDVGLCGQQHLVPVDQQEDVDHIGQARRTRRAHAAGRSRHDPDCHAQFPVLLIIDPDVTSASPPDDWLRRIASQHHAGFGSVRSALAGVVATSSSSPWAPLLLMARSSVPR